MIDSDCGEEGVESDDTGIQYINGGERQIEMKMNELFKGFYTTMRG
jgi:hypothetical protein